MRGGSDGHAAVSHILARERASICHGSDGGVPGSANDVASHALASNHAIGGPSTGRSPKARKAPAAASVVRRALIALAWLVAWQLASVVVGMPLILPGPLAVCARLGELVVTSAFWLTLAATLTRVALGFALAFVPAVVLGVISSRWRLVASVLRPPLAVMRSTPIVCVIVLLLMWVGSRGVPAVAAFVVAFPPTYYAVREGMDRRDVGMGELFYVFGARGAIRALAYCWPAIAPSVAAASETSCSMALKAGVAAELIGSPLGTVGERIYQAKLLLETADVLAWTVVVVMAAALLTRAFVALVRASPATTTHLAVWLAARRGVRSAPAVAAICLDGVTLAYGEHTVAANLTRFFGAGSRTVMNDASGTGKTTLVRAMAGIKKVGAGNVATPVTSVVFQDTQLVEGLSAIDNVTLLTGVTRGVAKAALDKVLPAVDVGAPVATLSGGQRRRVELVRALLAPSAAVLLDEPFAALDDEARAACSRFVLDHLAGRTLVVASHNANDATLLSAELVRVFA